MKTSQIFDFMSGVIAFARYSMSVTYYCYYRLAPLIYLQEGIKVRFIMIYIFHLNCLSQSASRLQRHMTTQYETIYVSIISHVKVKVSSMAMKLTPQLFNTLLTNFSQPWNSVYLPFQNLNVSCLMTPQSFRSMSLMMSQILLSGVWLFRAHSDVDVK